MSSSQTATQALAEGPFGPAAGEGRPAVKDVYPHPEAPRGGEPKDGHFSSEAALADDEAPADWGVLSDLPGNPMMWVLILSELVVFGAFFAAFAFARVFHPAEFNASQAHLDRLLGGINTMVLLSSGLAAALAVRARADGKVTQCRLWLAGASLGGAAFMGVKLMEYADKARQGISIDTDTFFTLFYLMTGFHFLHVALGIIFLGVVAWRCSLENVETGCAFWHMVDLIWVLLYPLVYLIR